jgi:hypothetical protein
VGEKIDSSDSNFDVNVTRGNRRDYLKSQGMDKADRYDCEAFGDEWISKATWKEKTCITTNELHSYLY